MNKKVLVIFIIFAILLIIIASLMRGSSDNTNEQLSPALVNITGSESENVPQENQLNINGTNINNFYSKAKYINNQNDVLIVDDPDFQIVYLALFNKFLISIKSQDFNNVLTNAEQSFLNNLEIDKETACKLPVEINSPVGLGGTGKTLSTFSFCN